MHVILHSFACPLKPLTQASISIQPNKLVSLAKLSPTYGILPKKNATWLFLPCTRRRSPLRHVASLIPPGHLTSEILPRRHSTQISHIRNSSPPTFPPGYLTSGILSDRRFTFSGYLTSGILSSRRSTFSGYLTSEILSGRHSTFI